MISTEVILQVSAVTAGLVGLSFLIVWKPKGKPKSEPLDEHGKRFLESFAVFEKAIQDCTSLEHLDELGREVDELYDDNLCKVQPDVLVSYITILDRSIVGQRIKIQSK